MTSQDPSGTPPTRGLRARRTGRSGTRVPGSRRPGRSRIRLAAVPAAAALLLAATVSATAGTPALVHTIAVGAYPAAVAVSPDGATAYVANAQGDSLSVIDTATETVAATVSVGALPLGVAVSPDSAAVYVTAFGDDALTVVDPATDTVVRSISLSTPEDPQDNPVRVALSPDGRTGYVTLNGGAVAVVDLASGTVTHLVLVGDHAYDIAVSPDGSAVYLTTCRPAGLTTIDAATDRITRFTGIGGCSASVAVTPDGSALWVTSDSGLELVDTATGSVAPPLPVAYRSSVVLSPDGRRAYATDAGTDSVDVLDTSTRSLLAAIPVGASPGSIALSPDGYTAYVSDRSVDTVSVLDTGTASTPTITRQPHRRRVLAGHRATFTASVAGPLHPRLQWQQQKPSGPWTDITGANGPRYTTPALRVADSGTRYRVIATNREGYVASRAAVVVVVWVPWIDPPGRR